MSLEESRTVRSDAYVAQGTLGITLPPWNAQLPEVVAITQEMFGTAPTVETMFDPEDPEETPFALLRVRCPGPTQDLAKRYIEWGRRLDAIHAGLQYRLSIIPVV